MGGFSYSVDQGTFPLGMGLIDAPQSSATVNARGRRSGFDGVRGTRRGV